jgi:uracil phosphoribosyltransferase
MRESLLTLLRDEKTPVELFRQAAHQLASLLAAEASNFVDEEPKMIKTPMGEAEGTFIDERVVLIPILRAGLVLLPAFIHYFPQAPIGCMGIRRDEQTAKPHLYYESIPVIKPEDHIFILDPMIATAGTALLTIEHLIKKGASTMTLVGMLASKEGIEKIEQKYPDVLILTAAVDPELSSHHFIVPGLGDFGDRYFGK